MEVEYAGTASSEVTVYWRPGCPYCSGLRRRLRHLGLHTVEVNIWQDPQGAATVRRLAGGNETVPTVVIGDTSLVNPTGSAVLEVARRLAPASIDPLTPQARRHRVWPTVSVAGWVVTLLAVAAGLRADSTGHSSVSWFLDAVAVVAYVAVRVTRRWPARSPVPPAPKKERGS